MTDTHTAIVRVDSEPSGKKFQGVWLELSPERRWVIAYRPRAHWRSFEDVEVEVTGHCYRPPGQAINATHFHVDTMRPVDPRKARRYLAIHPERLVRGTVIAIGAEAGSKAAGSTMQHFVEDSGTSWMIADADEQLTPRELTARIRTVDLSRTWAAGPTGPHVYIGSTYAADYVPDPQFAPMPCACD